jgi:hypothetical protein
MAENTFNDDRALLLSELNQEQDYGILLTAQIGGVPNELQLLVETAVYDEEAEGLRPRSNYIIRALGVREHRISLGVFGRLAFTREHPLLFHHNLPRYAVQFEGKADNLHELILDISQAYASTFGSWRHLTEISADINRALPLVDLLGAGDGLLGIMPQPLAERMERVLTHHGIKVTKELAEPFTTQDEHGRSRASELLLIDQTLIVALAFSVDKMQPRKAK